MTNNYSDDEIKQINNFLHLNDTLRMLLSNYKEQNKEAVIGHLQGHLTFVKSILMDLGIKFDEIEKIRSLNLRIRDLEATFESPEFNETTVSAYVAGQATLFKDYLKKLGLRGSSSLKFTPDISASVNIYSISKESENFEQLNNNFELLKLKDEDDYHMAYSQNNISKFERIMYEYFKTPLNIEYKVRTYVGEDKVYIAVIHELEIYVPVSAVGKALSEAFRSR